MERLARQEAKTIVDKLLIFREGGTFKDLVASIGSIVEERMTNMLHMGSDLMRAACLQHTFDKRDITKRFDNTPMRDGIFSPFGIVSNMHHPTVMGRTFKIAYNGTLVLVKAAPNQGVVLTLDGVVEELLGQDNLRILVLGNKKEPRSVLVYTVYQIGHNGVAIL